MVRDTALAIQLRAMRDWVALLGRSDPGSSVVERDGVTAAVVPACPERSIVNSVTFTGAVALAARLGELANIYERAGVNAWTVWVPDFDRDTVAALEAAGHAFDGRPLAMVLDLDGYEPRDPGDLDWDASGAPELLGGLNDLAYGLSSENGFGHALHDPPADAGLRIYQARVDGEPACVLGTLDHEGGPVAGPDLGFYFVATHPDQRGRGLAARLMAVALGEAIERGCLTSSLQASAMGEGVYRRLGFEPCFRLEMYERRGPVR